MRRVVAAAVVCLSIISLSSAADVRASIKRSVTIAPQDLGTALHALSKDRDFHVVFFSEDVSRLKTRGANGDLTIEEALNQLLRDTGLTYRYIDDETVSILPLAAAPPAQEAPAPQTSAETAQTDVPEEVVVTGSRIRRSNLDSSVPVTSISGEEFFQTGQTSIGDALNELPALRTTVSQTNSTRLIGTPGLNLLDLRGLGTDRTLVLQNGRRHLSGAPSGTAPDINTIPVDLIERVDVVTGGSSAIYGSDAIAGVVNFVLKRDFEGLQVRGQGGISEHGDAGQYHASALWGTNFREGRGNVAVNLEYARQDDWYASERKSYRTADFFLPVDFDDPGSPNGSDGNPDSIFFNDIRYVGLSNAGQFLMFAPDEAGYFPAYNFRPDGTLSPQAGQRVSLAPVGFTIGGDGSNIQEGRQLGLYPRLDRYSLNLVGHYTLSEALEPFVEAKYVRVDAIGSSTGPFFTAGALTPREQLWTDNAFLNPQARQFIRNSFGLADGEETQFFFGRNYLELGTRQEAARRETYRFVGGLRGDFNSDWSYEVSANYGELDSRTRIVGNVDVQRYLLAVDAVRDSGGNIVCRAQIDPAARIAYEGAVDQAYAQARLAADVSGCVPLNPFGEGNISRAAKDYVLTDTASRFNISQFVLNAFTSGDSSEWFELPAGPVGFAVGAEYRRETFRNTQDPIVEAGVTFYSSQPAFAPPAFEVKELFGELRIPLLENRPFFHNLTVNAAGRVADYNGATGTVFAWNGGLEWAPVRDLRFRANFSRAVRAPNLVEVYSPLGQNFDGAQDPCALQNIGSGSATREANCRAAGVPADFNFVYISEVPFLSGGNPDLDAEKSDSVTIGAVFQPELVPGLSLSIDHYTIKVKDVITAPGLQQLLDSCYDAADIDNQFCALFQRNAGPGLGPRGEVPGQIIDNSLRLVPLNYAALEVRGIDIEANYRRHAGRLGLLGTRFTYTRALQNDSFLDPTDPGRANRILLELGDPRDAFNWSVDLAKGPLTVGYQMRYIGRMTPGAIENIRSVQGRAPEDEDAYSIRYYPDVFYHDLRASYDLGRSTNIYVGVDNLGDRLPPFGLSGTGDQGGIYNIVGRFFYAGASARF